MAEGIISSTGYIWGIIILLLIVFGVLSYLYALRKNRFNSLLIIDRPIEMTETKQLDLNRYEHNLQNFLGNTTQFTLLVWLFINPVNKGNLRANSKGILPLTNILCKGMAEQPLPMILYNHYTDSIYIYLSVSGSQESLLDQIKKDGNRFWVSLEQHPEKYPNIYIIPNILVGRWFHLGVIINGQILEVYINSKLAHSIILQNSLIVDEYQNMIHIGSIKNNNINIEGLKGEISQLRYIPGILSIKKINEIYENGLNKQSDELGWIVKSSEWIGNKAEKYIMPIPERIADMTRDVGARTGDRFRQLGDSISDSNLFQNASSQLGRGLLHLQKGDLGNRLVYGSNYKQSVPYLQNDQELLSIICNKPDYMPNPLPSRQTIGNNQRQCNNDCDCYGDDTCLTNTYTCDSSLKIELNPTASKESCSVSNQFEERNGSIAVQQKKNEECKLLNIDDCFDDDDCTASASNCSGEILNSYKNIRQAGLKRLNTRPVNSYMCNKLCLDDTGCSNAIYDRELQSCFSNGGKDYCTTRDSHLTSTRILGE